MFFFLSIVIIFMNNIISIKKFYLREEEKVLFK
jgi:hypothetical protein